MPGFFLCLFLFVSVSQADDGWIALFDGKSLDGWKASENTAAWRAVDGTLAFDGGRSHLFYAGKDGKADFRNFEMKADVKTRPFGNSGIFFHTEFQEKGFPSKGFEVQVCNTTRGGPGYGERKKTASLYGVRNVYKQFVNDDEWFELHFIVRRKQVQIRLNGMLVVDYVEPDPPVTANERGRVIDHGTFALQGHDPASKVFYKNLMVKRLPEDITTPRSSRPAVDDLYRELLRLSSANYPVVDYHVHLKPGLTAGDAVAESRRLGINYGIAVNGGLRNTVENDAGAEAFIASLKGQPVFIGFQAEGREWLKMFSPQTIAKFDYVFTDAMTFTGDKGKRMRLWIKDEVGEIADKQAFMEIYVNRIEGILNSEPIDIYANPTFLPEQIAGEYDRLWTTERIERVIGAAKKNDVAIEINNRYRIPSVTFIREAKKAGVKFSCGTNNSDAKLGRIEYCVQMIKECDLRSTDFFTPRAEGEKPVQRRLRSAR